jgi:hypothetical protein
MPLAALVAAGCLSIDEAAPKDDAGIAEVGVLDDAGWIVGVFQDGGTADSGLPLCQACVGSQCSAELSACLDAAECAKIVQCGTACSFSACITTCINSHPNGHATFVTLANCAAKKCSAQCSLP